MSSLKTSGRAIPINIIFLKVYSEYKYVFYLWIAYVALLYVIKIVQMGILKWWHKVFRTSKEKPLRYHVWHTAGTEKESVDWNHEEIPQTQEYQGDKSWVTIDPKALYLSLPCG